MSLRRDEQPGRLRAADADGAFADAYGCDLASVMDLKTWSSGQDLQAAHDRLEREVAEALEAEDAAVVEMRRRLNERLADESRPGRPAEAGLYKVNSETLIRAQRQLFLGKAAAVGATAAGHETLPLGVTQLGACLCRYNADDGRGGWGMRLFRRDVRERRDPADDLVRLLERRELSDNAGRDGRAPELARRGLRAYAERAILLDETDARWRLGGGPFAPFELLTGGGGSTLLNAGLDLLTRWVESGVPFAFVAGDAGEAVLRTVGGALRPGEFALVATDQHRCNTIVEQSTQRPADRRRAERFVDDIAPRVTGGVYRVSRHAPPQAFWAPQSHAREAAIVLMADAALRPYSSRPVLLDLAKLTAEAAFARDAFAAAIQGGYARRNHGISSGV